MGLLSSRLLHLVIFIFAMAQIHRIGHDHQAPFWCVVLVLVLGYKAVTRGENKLPHGQYTLDPQYFLQILNLLISD